MFKTMKTSFKIPSCILVIVHIKTKYTCSN